MKLDKVSNPKPAWKNTLNTDLKHYGHVAYAHEAAKNLGYPYYVWMGWIYAVRPVDGQSNPLALAETLG
jgi:hypothetical protein